MDSAKVTGVYVTVIASISSATNILFTTNLLFISFPPEVVPLRFTKKVGHHAGVKKTFPAIP